jgi:hypothetical protein
MEPISTDGWETSELDARVAEVHDLFASTLEDWLG